jgi:hypothetical protein
MHLLSAWESRSSYETASEKILRVLPEVCVLEPELLRFFNLSGEETPSWKMDKQLNLV